MEIEAEHFDLTVKDEENGESEGQILPPQETEEVIGDDKSQFPSPLYLFSGRISDSHLSLIEQITASAAEAAVVALCYENMCPREMFEDENYGGVLGPSSQAKEREKWTEGPLNQTSGSSSEKSGVPLTLRMRAATAAALGAATVGAKLLVVQEDRDVEHLVSTIMDAQLKKLNYKMKHLEDLETMMEEELSEG